MITIMYFGETVTIILKIGLNAYIVSFDMEKQMPLPLIKKYLQFLLFLEDSLMDVNKSCTSPYATQMRGG